MAWVLGCWFDAIHTCLVLYVQKSTSNVTCKSAFLKEMQYNATALIRHHVINQEEPDDILQQLLQLAAYHIEVLPLSSGKSGAVSGEVCSQSQRFLVH